MGNTEGSAHSSQRGLKEQNGLYLVFPLCLIWIIYSSALVLACMIPPSSDPQLQPTLTKNPPLGLVTSVVPMVMFSLTSFKLGMVVFAKKNIEEYAA